MLALCIGVSLITSCVSNKIDGGGSDIQNANLASSRPPPPPLQPQDGSFIVHPKGTQQVKLSAKKKAQAAAAAEREIIRRKQATKDADAEVLEAIEDVKEGLLDEARSKLKKAVEKYPKTGG